MGDKAGDDADDTDEAEEDRLGDVTDDVVDRGKFLSSCQSYPSKGW